MHAIRSGLPARGDAMPVFAYARQLILEQEGLYNLTGDGKAFEDFFAHCNNCTDEMYPTVVEVVVRALDALDESILGGPPYANSLGRTFARDANEIFAQERVGWEVVDGRMIEIQSTELHHSVVEPALRLLHRGQFASADKAYREALGELADGKPWDAITDAGTALQETLSALGCEGNQLGDLIRSARTKGLLAPHDEPLGQAIDRILQWVAADRSQMGDSHHATSASPEDGWLIVHVVGAIIVRLASGGTRA